MTVMNDDSSSFIKRLEEEGEEENESKLLYTAVYKTPAPRINVSSRPVSINHSAALVADACMKQWQLKVN